MVYCQTFSVARDERNARAHFSLPASLLNRESSGENAKWTFCCSLHAKQLVLRRCYQVLDQVGNSLAIEFTTSDIPGS